MKIILLFISFSFFLQAQTFKDGALNVSVYPNPAVNDFNILVKNASITLEKVVIYNILGTEVINSDYNLDIKSKNLKKVNISKLKSGKYFVRILFSNHTTKTFPIIKL